MPAGRLRIAGLSVLLAVAFASVAGADLAVSAVVFDTAKVRTGEVGVETRLVDVNLVSGERWSLSPAFGLMATFEGAFYGYGSFRFDVRVSQPWTLTVHTGAGWYEQGNSKDLGGPVEFRSGLQVARFLADGRRIGVGFYHLSNASIYEDNPGSNSFVLIYGW